MPHAVTLRTRFLHAASAASRAGSSRRWYCQGVKLIISELLPKLLSYLKTGARFLQAARLAELAGPDAVVARVTN